MPNKKSDDSQASEDPDIIAQPFLRRIEKLMLALLSSRFASSDDLWQFQLDLLRLQRDIQAAIMGYKSQAKRKKLIIAVLNELRMCRWHARRLGDAFAWVVLEGNMQVIEPLSRNSRVVVARDGHGSRGMLLVAGHLARQGWGFPLIHDITDCLRIGDVTFVRVHEHSERTYNTVEVKTKARLKRRLEAENLAEYEYQMQVLSSVPSRDAQMARVALEGAEFDSVISPPLRPIGRRIGRQAKRMSTALTHQNAGLDKLIIEDDDVPALWTAVEAPIATHWKSLQRVVRKARRSGYGSECVDGTFLYVAFYRAEGLVPESVDHSRLREDLSNPALLVKDGTRGNVLSIALIPPLEQASAHLFRPYYLYPIPRSSICDLLRGRMLIFVCFNESRLAESLEEAGFIVDFNSEIKKSPFIVTGSAITKGGVEYCVQTTDLRHYLDEVIYEFRGLDSVVKLVSAMVSAGANVLT
jgi:hypothetical protein